MLISRLDHAKKLFSQTNWKYVERLCQKRYDFMSPVLTLDLTANCNYHCGYCIDKAIVNNNCHNCEIAWDNLKPLLIDLKRHGCNLIEITGGGEPTLYSHFVEFLMLASELNYDLALITNGSMLGKYYDSIIASSVDWIRVSLDASKAKTYENVHCITGMDFGALTQAIERIAKHKCIGLSFIILESNVDEMYDAAVLAKNIGASYIEFKPILGRDNTLFEYPLITAEKIHWQLLRIKNEVDVDVIYPSTLDNIYEKSDSNLNCLCMVLYLRTVLTPRGLFPCSYMRKSIWNNPIPQNAYEFIESRNQMIDNINKSRQEMNCANYCTRNSINILLNELQDIYIHYPKTFELIGWPSDFGYDIKWI